MHVKMDLNVPHKFSILKYTFIKVSDTDTDTFPKKCI